MNPDSAIRPWLIAAGQQYGIREAYNYRYPDHSTRPCEPYFTYRVLRSRPGERVAERTRTAEMYTAVWTGKRTMETIIRIRLYREVNGVEVLTQCANIAQVAEPIKRHFLKSGCAFKEIYEEIEDESPDEISITDGDFKDQIVQRMDVVFTDDVWGSLKETNGVVETLDFNLTFS